jgi:hypothetical protein
MKQVTFNIALDTEQIAYEASRDLSHGELEDFILLIDDETADWDFSVSLTNKLLRSLGSNFIIVANEQKKDASVTIQIDKELISQASIRSSTGVLEFDP